MRNIKVFDMRILLDIADFAKFHCVPVEKFTHPEVWITLGYPSSELFWKCMPYNFFRYLEPTKEMKEIVSLVKQYDPDFHICTSPPREDIHRGYATLYKQMWINDQLGQVETIFIRRKSLLANGENVLIDDDVAAFGVHGILVPRPWNGGSSLNVEQKLKELV
jgi:hypothetical protein